MISRVCNKPINLTQQRHKRDSDAGMFLFALTLFLASFSTLAEKPLRAVADPRYGVVLYEYYQSNHFAALSELMVAEQKGGIQGHKDNPKLMRGSLTLALGLDKQAGIIYSDLLDANKPLEVKNTAWFYLSKIRYQRGEYESVNATLAKIISPISTDLLADVAAMRIQLLLKQNKVVEAEALLAETSAISRIRKAFDRWRPYLNFNVATAYIRINERDRAALFLEKVIVAPISKNVNFQLEQLALYDRAYLASAFSFFQNQEYQKAVDNFGRVRQSAAFSNDALLGLGWAEARLGNFEAALVPWSVLGRRTLTDESVQESLIAAPFAYLQLGDSDKAIERYTAAESIFTEQLVMLENVATQIQNESIIDILQLDESDTRYSWLQPEKNSLVASPSEYLSSLFALNRLQNPVQTLSDLLKMKRRLEQWQENLVAYTDLLNYRSATFRNQKKPEGYGVMTAELKKLELKKDELIALLDEAKSKNNVFMLLDEARQDLLELVESGESNLEFLSKNDELINEEALWIKRYRGLLLWSASQDFAERLWRVETQINEIKEVLAFARSSTQAIDNLLINEPDIVGSLAKIAKYSARVNTQLANNQQVMASLENDIRSQIFATLSERRGRVQFYLAQTRLAVAQLYDQQYLKRPQE
jgi:hypothetical protein